MENRPSTDNQAMKKQTSSMLLPVIFAIIAILAFVLNSSKNQNTKDMSKDTQIMQQEDKMGTKSTTSTKEISDGTYEATGNYTSPGGPEEIEVEVVVKDGVITEANVTPQATRPNSVKFQNIFKDNFKSQVIGKKITEVKLDKVSGSSLTPKGFNDAIEKIITQNS